ncbi:MAG: rhomboid family intramembrane serine protease [Anaerolineae bacterium]
MTVPQDPQPERRRHPLEERPAPRPPQSSPPGRRVNLRIASVSPTVTYALIAINLLVFVIRAFSPQLDEQLFVWGANNGPLIFQQGEYYRLLTAMFLHAGIYREFGGFALQNSLHIISNMYVLYAVGLSLERLIGHARFLIIYLLGGLLGSILSALLGGDNAYSVGASGAVFAILGAEFVYLWHQRRLMGVAGQSRRRTLIAFAIITFIGGFMSRLPGTNMQIDNWGHAGGLIGGLILAWFISPILNLRPHPENPNDLQGIDVNPLSKNYWIVSIYVTGLIVLMFIGYFLAHR